MPVPNDQIVARMNGYVDHLQTLTVDRVDVRPGRKYWKVVMVGSHQTFVHAFIDRATGDVYKPAGWAAPAKGVRYNLLTGYDKIITWLVRID